VTPEEDAWVTRAKEGDLEAFEAIMIHYEPRILRFLTGLLGNVQIAEELCQDTFIAAYQALPKTQGAMRLSPWLHTIALNRARSHQRYQRLRRFLPLPEHDVPSTEPRMDEGIVMRDAVQRALRRLPKSYAQPLLLQTASGLSCREIAEVLHCNEGAVRVRLMRARTMFRRLYEEESV
jgi:RNA polymerase sigma-70 factor (ECF subfamily)